LIVILIQGWTESGVLKESLLRKVLENIPGVKVIVPDYLEKTARGKFAKFRTHLRIEQYAAIVAEDYLQVEVAYPGVPIMVVGHSLGGVIARFLHAKDYVPAKNLVLVGTPNKGITYRTVGGEFGKVVLPLLKFLARKELCDVPVLYQLLEGSDFLNELNKRGIPEEAQYISGEYDNVVPLWSSDPLDIGISIKCGHHLFPSEEELVGNSAIPIVELIVRSALKGRDLK
jgi:pimeloyl-ACP methyl ester carboxylesterase